MQVKEHGTKRLEGVQPFFSIIGFVIIKKGYPYNRDQERKKEPGFKKKGGGKENRKPSKEERVLGALYGKKKGAFWAKPRRGTGKRREKKNKQGKGEKAKSLEDKRHSFWQKTGQREKP